MQYPQYSFKQGIQSSPRVPSEGYSVLQNNSSVDDSKAKGQSESQDYAIVSQKPQRAFQRDGFQGETHKFSDQPATTWHWRSENQNARPALPIQEAPRAEHVPANVQSFAPPVDLGQLQRVNPPQIQRHFTSDMYKSPIDRPYVGKARITKERLNASDESNNGIDEATSYFKEQSGYYFTKPERDDVTEAKEFMSPKGSDRSLFVAPATKEASPGTGKKLIVLRSQSSQQLAEARAKVNQPSIKRPDAQLLTPNFESYVGSPALDTTRDAYQDGTQWKAYTPEPEVVDVPPPAVFESLPKVSAQPPVVEYSPPAPGKPVFEAPEEVAGLPELPPAPTTHIFEAPQEVAMPPEPAPAPKVEENLFHAGPVVAKDVFSAASDVSVNRVSVPEIESTKPSYRIERYQTEAGVDVESSTTAMTVAHTTPVAQPITSEPGWLSPWWMLVCLVPLAMYLVKRRGGEYDDYSYEYDDVEDRPRLPQEMIERPGYSKSDAVYGETDDFFATEQHFSQVRNATTADAIPMATHLRVAGESFEDLDDTVYEQVDNIACEVRDDIEHDVHDDSECKVSDQSACEVRDDSEYVIREDAACEVRDDIDHEMRDDTACEVRDDTADEIREETACEVRDDIEHELRDDTACEVRDDTEYVMRDGTMCEARDNIRYEVRDDSARGRDDTAPKVRDDTAYVMRDGTAYEMRDGTTCEARDNIKYEVHDSNAYDEFDETSFDELDNAAHTDSDGALYEDLDDIFSEDTVTTNSIPVARFANSNSVQTEIELDGDDSPNFRSQADDARRSEDQMRDPIAAPSAKTKRKKRRNRKKGRR